MKTHPSKPPRAAGMSFLTLAGIRLADLAHKSASTAAAPPPAAKPQPRRPFSVAAMEAALRIAHLVGLGGGTTRPSATAGATPARVATTTTTPTKATPRPACAGPATSSTTQPPRPVQARPVLPAVDAKARRHAEARAAAHAHGLAAGRLEARQRGLAIFDAAVSLRGTPQGLNLPALAEIAADPAMPVDRAAALLVRLSAPTHHAARAARNPDIGPGRR